MADVEPPGGQLAQGQLWAELPPREKRKRGGAGARPAKQPARAETLPLWAEPAAPVAEAESVAKAEPALERAAGPEEPAAPVVPSDGEQGALTPALSPWERGRTRGLSQREKGQAARPARRVDADAEEGAWEQVAGWLEELGETGGKSGEAVRRFVAAFPPGQSWADGFRPLALSYAAALREVVAGRRRVRVDGREGTLTLGLAPDGAWRLSAF